MTNFTLHSFDTAPDESKPLLSTIASRFGFLPNVYAHLAEAPQVLDALLQLSAIFSRTSLSEKQRHVLLLTSSVENECSFCVAAHTRGAAAGGVNADSVEAIRNGVVPEDPEDAAMVRFVRAMIRSRGFVSDAELREFFERGFTPRNALEVILGVALKVLTNYANHITHTELNPQLAAYAWNR